MGCAHDRIEYKHNKIEYMPDRIECLINSLQDTQYMYMINGFLDECKAWITVFAINAKPDSDTKFHSILWRNQINHV